MSRFPRIQSRAGGVTRGMEEGAGAPARSGWLAWTPVVAVADGLLSDVLGRAALVQVEQHLQELVQAGSSALLLHPGVEQLVEPVLEGLVVFALDHVVVDVELAEELLVVADVQLLEKQEAAAQRLRACGRRPGSAPPRTARGRESTTYR